MSQKTIDMDGNEREIQTFGRHDPCICPRVVPVIEAMACMVLPFRLADIFLLHSIEPRFVTSVFPASTTTYPFLENNLSILRQNISDDGKFLLCYFLDVDAGVHHFNT